MNKRSLMIVLAVSLALNLFAAAAAMTAYVNRATVQERIEQTRPDRVRIPAMEVVETLDESKREAVRTMLREAALAARPDFQEARQARRGAIALSEAEVFDATAVSALLEQSRASELRGRARLEGDAVRVLSELNAEERARMSVILMRHGPRHRQRSENATPDGPAAAETPSGE